MMGPSSFLLKKSSFYDFFYNVKIFYRKNQNLPVVSNLAQRREQVFFLVTAENRSLNLSMQQGDLCLELSSCP